MIRMKSIAVFGRLSGADRFKPVIIGADMNFFAADFNVCKPSAITLGYAENSILVVMRHGFVFWVLLPINFAQVFYSVIKSIVVYVVNDVRCVTVDIKPCKSMCLKMRVLMRYKQIASHVATGNFTSVPEIPPVIVSSNKRLWFKYKYASIWIVVKRSFQFALSYIKYFHSMIIT